MTKTSKFESRLSWTQICARRLDRHHLSTPATDAGPADVVAGMCGAHAQVMAAAEISIGLRVGGATRADVRDALWTERSLVKTRGARGTVHLLPTRELPMWIGALSAIPPIRGANPNDSLVTPEQSDEIVAAVADALADAELTVDELTEAIVARVGPWAGDPVMDAFQTKWPRWRAAESRAVNRGALCFGPNRGRKVTYTSPQRWFPGFQPMDGQSAVAALVKRYLYAYGPATPMHFAQWLNAPRRWVEDLFDSLPGELEYVALDGMPAWLVAGDTVFPESPPRGLRLLPYFDAYAVGCHPRDRLFPGRAYERALAGGQAGNYPVLLIDGVVAGVWHLRRSGRNLAVTVEPFDPLTSAQRRELDEQVERIGDIIEGTPSVTIGAVTVGPHA